MAAASTQAQTSSSNFTGRGRVIPVNVGGRNPRLIPKRGQVLKNALRVIFSSCIPCMKPIADSRKSSTISPS